MNITRTNIVERNSYTRIVKPKRGRGRPKIEGLTPFNLRVQQAQVDALDALVVAERVARNAPKLSRTDLIREFIAKGLAENAAQ